MRRKGMLVTSTLLFCFFLSGQSQDNIYTIVDQMPYFIGCDAYADGSTQKQLCSNHSVVDYISHTLSYPALAQEESIEGIVYISFIVDEKGKIIRPTILKDIGGGCGEEAIKVVKEMPTWQPGLLRGGPVKVQLTLPISFQFSDTEMKDRYSLRWGSLETYQITKKEIKKNLSEKPQIYNEEGVALSLASLTFTSNKGNKIVSAKSSGLITPKMEKVVKRLRKGSLFSIIATIQVKGGFIEIDKEFVVI